jgi:dTDP-4-amino-4,6-dideoxygalactose transaminase
MLFPSELQTRRFSVAEHAALHTLALPIYPELSDAQLEYVVEKIKAFYLKKS